MVFEVWPAMLVFFCLMTTGVAWAGEQPPLELAVSGGSRAIFTAPNHYLPSEVTFTLGGQPSGVTLTGVEILGIGPAREAGYDNGPSESGKRVTTHLVFESGNQADLVTNLIDGLPSLSLSLTGGPADLKGLVLELAGADRLIFKKGADFTVQPLAAGSGLKTMAGPVVLQNASTQEGLTIACPQGSLISAGGSPNGAMVQVVFPSASASSNRSLMVSAFRGDSLLAYENAAQTPVGQQVQVATQIEPTPAAGSGPGLKEAQPTEPEAVVGRPEFWPDRGRAFARLKADPREAYFRFGFLNDDEGDTYEDVGFGGDLGLLWLKLSEQEDLSLTVRGLLTGRFKLDSESFDLLNTDFIGGLALGYRRPADAFELYVYHQSSHLGDEILHRGDEDRIDYAREAVRLLWAHEFGPLRIYAGPTFNLHALPEAIDNTWILQTGAEYNFDIWGQPMWAAADIQSRQEQGWNLNSTFQLGMELGDTRLTSNRQFLFTEFFAGHSNMGQFWKRYETYQMIGIGYEFK